jgi:hypothetical protein
MSTPPFRLAPSAWPGLLAPAGGHGAGCCREEEAGADAAPARRSRLHELASGFHCSIIGTCLGTHALRKVMSRHVETRGLDDSELHHDAVGLAAQPGAASKALHKALDLAHAQAVAQFERVSGAESLAAAWKRAMEDGDIPGAYWAVFTHPDATAELRKRVFGDVHMLSHLVGSANRADIRRLAALQQENGSLQERLEEQGVRAQRAVAERDATIADLAARLEQQTLRAVAAEEALRRQADSAQSQPASDDPDRLALQVQRREQAEQAMAVAQDNAARLAAEVEVLVERERMLQAELAALEEQCRGAADVSAAGDSALAPSLRGRRLLYVGGRPSSAAAIRDLVQRHGGILQRHDGGLEDRKGLLAAAVAGADLVAFPVDCIDHDSAGHLKRVCVRHGIPFLALRTASIASFVAGLAGMGSGRADAPPRPPICLRHG